VNKTQKTLLATAILGLGSVGFGQATQQVNVTLDCTPAINVISSGVVTFDFTVNTGVNNDTSSAVTNNGSVSPVIPRATLAGFQAFLSDADTYRFFRPTNDPYSAGDGNIQLEYKICKASQYVKVVGPSLAFDFGAGNSIPINRLLLDRNDATISDILAGAGWLRMTNVLGTIRSFTSTNQFIRQVGVKFIFKLLKADLEAFVSAPDPQTSTVTLTFSIANTP
jgi:hypothetical protein